MSQNGGLVKLGVLGPVEVRADGQVLDTGHSRRRAVLAVLLLELGRVVPVEVLIDRVWGENPPASARGTLYGYVARLRSIIVRALDPHVTLSRQPGGYLLRASAEQLDLLQYRRLAAQAAGSDDERGARLLRQALGLWRGPALAGVRSYWLNAMRDTLEAERLAAVEDLNDIRLRQGEHGALVVELIEQAAERPADERLIAQLMLALYRSGRQADALRLFDQTRQYLASEVGVDPGSSLRTLHQQILRADPALAAPEPRGINRQAPAGNAAKTGNGPEAAVPRQLPTATRHFTGRRDELGLLTRLAEMGQQPAEQAHSGGTVVISAIDGMAGIGKTTLAVHAAHWLAGAFPDGQLFIDMHGYTRGHEPRPPGEALDVFLRALGVPPQQVPAGTEERAALYRQRLAGTRTMIVLDNAASEAQVRPLLPGSVGCLVLVTSRRQLKGLDDACVLALDVLPQADALALFRAVAGPGRVAADDPALPEIAALCGQLPLALRIAATLLRHRPAWTPGHLARRLRDQHARIATLSDGERDLDTVFSLSYRSLTGPQQLMFRRIGLLPGPDTDSRAAAALAGTDSANAARLLEDLTDHNLLIQHAPGRYRPHDLIRLHARQLAALDVAADRDAAFDRLLDYYQHTASRADALISHAPWSAPAGPPPAYAPALPDADAGRTWLRTERTNLLAALQQATSSGKHERIIALTAGLANLLFTDGPWSQAIVLHTAAAAAADRQGDRSSLARAMTQLGELRRVTCEYQAAAKDLERALQIYTDLGDKNGQAQALTGLGGVQLATGDYLAGARELERALQICTDLGDKNGQAYALALLGPARGMTGDFLRAASELEQAHQIYTDLGDKNGQAYALLRLGPMLWMTGDYPRAASELERALSIYTDLGERHRQAHALCMLGEVRQATCEYQTAAKDLERALQIYTDLGDKNGQAQALSGLGGVRLATGDLRSAVSHLEAAVTLFHAIGAVGNEAHALNRYATAISATGDTQTAQSTYQDALRLGRQTHQPDEEALAIEGIGKCHLHTGDIEAATAHLERALAIFERLAMKPDADRVRSGLTSIGRAG